jgi:hypothetical protein
MKQNVAVEGEKSDLPKVPKVIGCLVTLFGVGRRRPQ